MSTNALHALHKFTEKENRLLYQHILAVSNLASANFFITHTSQIISMPLFSMCVRELQGPSLSVGKLHVEAVVGK